jgi:hypothetical protein
MADRTNSLTLDVSSWVPADEWGRADERTRHAYLDECCRLARRAKEAQVLRAQGADGAKLEKRKRPRPDGAKGPVLAPHRTESRTYKWVRCSPAKKRGAVVLWWSHSWGRVVGYHAGGKVPGAPVRDVIGFPIGVLNRLKSDARSWWRNRRVTGPRATPRVAASPGVVYLPRGVPPAARSKKIQVY